MSDLETALAFQMKAVGLPKPIVEHEFHPTRKWRFDFCWLEPRIAVECEGGTWVKGRHSRGKSFEEDCVKYNEAALLGWRIFRFTTDQVKRGEAVLVLQRAFARAA